MLITKGWSNPFQETRLRNLALTTLLYYKSIPLQVVYSEKNIREKREIERNEKYAIKWNKHWRAYTYHKITSFIVLICHKEKYAKRRSVTIANTSGYMLLKFPVDI